MRTSVIPRRLQSGDEVRVVAPSCSLAMIGAEVRELAVERLADLGLRVTFGRHVEECNDFVSSEIAHRVADIHDAFADPAVKGILSVIGGYNANQLLPYLDWDLIGANPKVFCGYSDITAVSGAIQARTGLVTFSGPHFSTFGMVEHFDQTLDWFRAALFDGAPIDALPSATWSDDAWYADQTNRNIMANDGHWVISGGVAEGPLLGGNLCTLNLLHGTPFMPDLRGAIVFVEDDFESHPATFDRDLTSLTQQPGFDQVAAVLIGRFQRSVEMTRSKLEQIVDDNSMLRTLPVVANLDFGHTDPIMTIPVGGRALLSAQTDGAEGSERMELRIDGI